MCRNGEGFADRPQFGEHIKQHPGKFAVGDCCNGALQGGHGRLMKIATSLRQKNELTMTCPLPTCVNLTGFAFASLTLNPKTILATAFRGAD